MKSDLSLYFKKGHTNDLYRLMEQFRNDFRYDQDPVQSTTLRPPGSEYPEFEYELSAEFKDHIETIPELDQAIDELMEDYVRAESEMVIQQLRQTTRENQKTKKVENE